MECLVLTHELSQERKTQTAEITTPPGGQWVETDLCSPRKALIVLPPFGGPQDFAD